MAANFELKVLSPNRQLAVLRTSSLTLPGTEGYMTILPDHAAMVAELDVGELSFQAADGTERYFIAGGYVEVDSNHVTVLADVIEKAKEIDVSRAEKAQKRAVDRLTSGDSAVDIERANRAFKRAEVRVYVAQTLASAARLH